MTVTSFAVQTKLLQLRAITGELLVEPWKWMGQADIKH